MVVKSYQTLWVFFVDAAHPKTFRGSSCVVAPSMVVELSVREVVSGLECDQGVKTDCCSGSCEISLAGGDKSPGGAVSGSLELPAGDKDKF